jgi:hypothetical protein
LFEEWLTRHLPDKKDKILHRIRVLRRGKLSNSEFGLRMRGEGIFAEQIARLFDVACRKAGWSGQEPELSVVYFRRPGGSQMELSLTGDFGGGVATRECAKPNRRQPSEFPGRGQRQA